MDRSGLLVVMSRAAVIKIFVLCSVLAALVWLLYPRVIDDAYENLAFKLSPTPTHAFELGGKHFNAIDADMYDLERAEHFFSIAARDQSLPYINHELARIAFLKGDFALALSRINLQISMHGTSTPNSYYIRGLIQGFRGNYAAAIRDYETYLDSDPYNWAALNDYAWVLLKNRQYEDALVVIDRARIYWPENPWLHNSRATALFELGRLEEAKGAAESALKYLPQVNEDTWLQAYPGNDPLIAREGVDTFAHAVKENMHTIENAIRIASEGVQ